MRRQATQPAAERDGQCTLLCVIQAALLKRCQDVLIHACIIGTARMKLPKYFGKKKEKIKTLDNIDQVYAEVQGIGCQR